MKLNFPKHIFVAMLGLYTATATAQNTQSGYFVDDYTYRFQMNPAIGNSHNFVSMPGLGNVNVAMDGNLGINNVLFDVNGRTSLFLNPGVSVEQVMDGLHDSNRVGADVKLSVLSSGFKAWGGYNTVSVNARVGADVRIPKALFSLLKEGVQNSTYDISNVRARATSYAEIALGHSHDISPEWRVGATLKFLVGIGDMDARFHDARLTLGTDDWSIVADADMHASVKGLSYKTDIYTDKTDGKERRYVSGIAVDGFGPNGFGLGLDLGAIYKPAALPAWEFSASVLDLGFVSWGYDMVASTNGVKTFNTSRYTFSASENDPNSFSDEWDKVSDDISAIYQLDDMGDLGSRTTSLAATVNVGAKFTLPVYKPLSFGLLNTTRINGDFSWTDFRLSANIAPCRVFSGSVNMSAGTFGVGFGWMANLHVTGFNLFLGMDRTLGRLAKQGVPLSSNGQVNMGINFLF